MVKGLGLVAHHVFTVGVYGFCIVRRKVVVNMGRLVRTRLAACSAKQPKP
eukprot:SAG11_NODE_3388_length_2479_cov_2.572269_4_plen_50_part_00